ncbi:MAG: hypothetical protein V4729_04640 [Pseudomonadota bacterium]
MIVEISDKFEVGHSSGHAVSSVSKQRLYELALRELEKKGAGGSGNYSIGVPDSSDRICFHDEGIFWVVYFSERGKRTTPAFFASSLDALAFFVEKVVSNSK